MCAVFWYFAYAKLICFLDSCFCIESSIMYNDECVSARHEITDEHDTMRHLSIYTAKIWISMRLAVNWSDVQAAYAQYLRRLKLSPGSRGMCGKWSAPANVWRNTISKGGLHFRKRYLSEATRHHANKRRLCAPRPCRFSSIPMPAAMRRSHDILATIFINGNICSDGHGRGKRGMIIISIKWSLVQNKMKSGILAK